MLGYYVENMMGGGVTEEAFMILFWVALVIFIVWILKSPNTMRDDTLSALDILKERYARGEIDKKEFDLKKGDLVA